MSIADDVEEFLSARRPNPKQKSFFDERAGVWDTINHNDHSKIEYIVNLLNLAEGTCLLDIGTGTGVMIPYYLEKVRSGRIVAVDYSERMIEQAMTKHPPDDVLEYCVSDVVALEPTGDFDYAVCYSCFPHFPSPREALRSICGTLKHGGRLMIAHSCSKEFINRVHSECGEEVNMDFLPEISVMASLFEEQGLKPVFLRDDEEYYIIIGEKV